MNSLIKLHFLPWFMAIVFTEMKVEYLSPPNIIQANFRICHNFQLTRFCPDVSQFAIFSPVLL